MVLAVRRRHDHVFSYVPGAGVVENLHRFVFFDLTTSLGFDLPRAVTNSLLFVLGRPVLAALRRAARRASFEPIIEPFVEAERAASS